jgi:hypothetical protein
MNSLESLNDALNILRFERTMAAFGDSKVAERYLGYTVIWLEKAISEINPPINVGTIEEFHNLSDGDMFSEFSDPYAHLDEGVKQPLLLNNGVSADAIPPIMEKALTTKEKVAAYLKKP